MLDARGNLDLESLEELLTSSGTPGPGPLQAYSSLALYFCIIFRDVFCIVSACFSMDFDLHVGVIFHMFCILFSSIDFTWICHQFCKDFHIFVEVLLLISIVLHPIGENPNSSSVFCCVCLMLSAMAEPAQRLGIEGRCG